MSDIKSENGNLTALFEAIKGASIVVKILASILVIGFCFSGIANLQQYENAIVLRFGAQSGEVIQEPGLILALPYPFDEIVKVPAKRTQTIESSSFWYKISDSERKTGIVEAIPENLKTGVDGYLISGDLNLLHLKCNLRYRIVDITDYKFGCENTDASVRLLLDNAILSVISESPIDRIMKDVSSLARSVRENVVTQVRLLNLGIEIDPIDLQVSWPRQLKSNINETMVSIW